MRFVVTGEWTRNKLLRLIVVFFLGYIVLFWLTNALLYFHKMSLSYQSVVDYYLGSEEKYLQPRSYRGMLEISHFHLFAMGMLMLTLTHLLLFVPISPGKKAFLICLSFSSALLEEGASWLVRFVHPLFAYLKIASFLALQLSLLLAVFFTLHALFTKASSAYTDTDPDKEETR